MTFEPGSVIAGKYRIERVIGQGGMGVVLAARHLGLDEMVAVKLIRQERAEGMNALARFQREARAAARIKSEHVARVLDVDRLPAGEPYIVMELIDGTDLDALLKRRRVLPLDEAVAYVVQACEGVAEAHALGMVHRDLKLKNLFLTKRRDGRALIKVIDFGVVKFSPTVNDDAAPSTESSVARRKATEATLTGAAMLVGSVHYMAPEQIRASNVVDARADVWSLGVCLFAMLTGSLPFDGETVASVCAAIQGRPPPDVRTLAAHVPADLASAVGRALEKDVRRRFANVAELAAAIAPHGTDLAAPARIETILQSSAPSSSAVPAPAEPIDVSLTRSAVKGRVESTIDAAAAGASLVRPAPAGRRPSWILGTVVLLTTAAATAAIVAPASFRRSGGPSPATRGGMPSESQSNVAPPLVRLSRPNEDVGTPSEAALATGPNTTAPPVASATPEPPVTTPRPTAGTSATARAAHTSKRPPKAPKPVAAPTPPPKPEPSSAYDQF